MKKLPILLIVLIFLLTSVQATTLEDLRRLKADFEKKYSIQLFFEEIPFSTWETDHNVVTKEFYNDLYDYMKVFDGELSKYPIKFLWKTRLRAIVLVRSLSVGGQLRGAIPDYYREILFYDFIWGGDFKTYQKHVVHHEFYHMIEQEFNQNAYWNDPKWNALNNPDTKYGRGGVTMQGSSNAYDYTHPFSGFVNLYAISSIEEDKAEVFASLFVKEEYEKIMKWSQKDKYLKGKVEYMKSFLNKNNKNFNELYWEELHK